MAGEIAFFEIGVEDFERGRAFYEGLFGWTFEPAPTEGYTIRTPSESGGMHGGDAGASPYLFFAVDDIDAAVARWSSWAGRWWTSISTATRRRRTPLAASSSARTTRARPSGSTSARRPADRPIGSDEP